jgi:hypothetical protein
VEKRSTTIQSLGGITEICKAAGILAVEMGKLLHELNQFGISLATSN